MICTLLIKSPVIRSPEYKKKKKYYDRNHHLIHYKEGDVVWLYDFTTKMRGAKKPADRWVGP